MSTDALVHQPKDLAVTQEQVNIARATVANGLNDDQFAVYLYNCQRQGVHPLDGLIVPIIRKDDGKEKLTFVTTVDLLRSRAAETNEYAGSDDPTFEYAENNRPTAATVTVWRFVQGQKCSFTATARYDEYFPGEKQGFMWKSKPHVMLGKCAEGLALRKAFPKQLAGLYLEEELQKEVDKPRERKPAPPPVGNVKCSECNATGGHLPKCSKRQQQASKDEPTVCASCGKTGSHEATCKYAAKSAVVEGEVVSDLTKAALMILKVEDLLKKADAKGKREPYLRISVVTPSNEEFMLYYWHETARPYLTNKEAEGKTMLCEYKSGGQYKSLENVIELNGVAFRDNKPVVEEEL